MIKVCPNQRGEFRAAWDKLYLNDPDLSLRVWKRRLARIRVYYHRDGHCPRCNPRGNPHPAPHARGYHQRARRRSR